MSEETVMCFFCTQLRELTDEEKQRYPQDAAWCEGEGGTKTEADIFASRHCSRFQECDKTIFVSDIPECSLPVRCLNCKKLEKLAYELATPTHHQNWLCRHFGDNKQYEDCAALRCCSHFQLK
jgi:hypothetical protein